MGNANKRGLRRPKDEVHRGNLKRLPKVPSGIHGLDEITSGGLPLGRTTLVCGGAGCGKTLFGIEFLVSGAVEHGDAGVYMAFEENADELAANVASLGFDLKRLQAEKKLFIDYVRVERSEIEDTGDYDLEGLFVRLQHAIDTVKAKRVVLDTLEALFVGLPNPTILRAELRRLFRWLKDRKLTVVVTGEVGTVTFTREGLEEYVSDCVIFLDHRIVDQNSTRRLRIVKYRGTTHGTNEYPFLIDEGGISILPITSLGLTHAAPTRRVPSGLPRLDEMLGGAGFFEGSTVLLSGTAGTGKTSLAALMARSMCEKGQRCLYFAFEESKDQLIRNMQSIGIQLGAYIEKDLLRVIAGRPTANGLERHLVALHKTVNDFKPALIVVDPISNLISVGTGAETRSMLTRLIDFLKSCGITAYFTSLTSAAEELERTGVGISSLIDTWLMLEIVRSGGERNRTLTVIKSRGMGHSNQTAEYRITSRGIEVLDTYTGPSGVVTGSARVAQEARDLAAATAADSELAQKQAERERRRKAFERELVESRERFEAEDAALERAIKVAASLREALAINQAAMAKSRQAFSRSIERSKNARKPRHP